MNHVIILAAGKGTRMKSELPKVLHPVKGVPIIKRLLKNIAPICERPTLVVGHKAEDVIASTNNEYHYIIQKEQLGTGHAVICAAQELKGKDFTNVIVLPGDHPLVSAKTLQSILDLHTQNQSTITLGTLIAPNFEGDNSVFSHYGRIIRNAHGLVDKIVEYKDATEEERAVREVNMFYYCFNAQWLFENISKLTNNNASQEYYLTDMVKIANDQGKTVTAYPVENIAEGYGINTPEQLRMVEDAINE